MHIHHPIFVANCSVVHAVATEPCPGACLFFVVKYDLFYQLDTTIGRLVQTLKMTVYGHIGDVTRMRNNYVLNTLHRCTSKSMEPSLLLTTPGNYPFGSWSIVFSIDSLTKRAGSRFSSDIMALLLVVPVCDELSLLSTV